MTIVSMASTERYWRALRFYSSSWRGRHGADMVTMMMDATDNGEDPLIGAGRRSLMWSGLRQRLASRPFAWLWVALIAVSAGVFTWSAHRMTQIGLYADAHQTDGGVDPWLWPVTIGAVSLFLAAVATLTISMLHVPPLPVRPAQPSRWGWTAWLPLALVLVMPFMGAILPVVSLVAGIRLYRRTRQNRYRALAGTSASIFAVVALIVIPSFV